MLLSFLDLRGVCFTKGGNTLYWSHCVDHIAAVGMIFSITERAGIIFAWLNLNVSEVSIQVFYKI